MGWNTPAWSLSCEFFFYLCFPLLFLWLGRGGLARIFPALGVCFVIPILLAHAGVPGAWKPIHHLSDFAAGIAAARIYAIVQRSGVISGSDDEAARILPLDRGPGGGRGVYRLSARSGRHGDEFEYRVAALERGAADRAGDRRRRFLVRLLSTDLAGYLGKASYSMYILHIPLLWWFSQYTFFRFGAAPPAWTGFLFMALVIGVSIAALEFVEVPANRWIRDWSSSRLQPAQLSALPAAA